MGFHTCPMIVYCLNRTAQHPQKRPISKVDGRKIAQVFARTGAPIVTRYEFLRAHQENS